MRGLRVLHDRALGDLQAQRRRRQPAVAQRRGDDAGEVRARELARRQVDGHHEVLAALGAPQRALAAGLFEYPLADSHDQAALLGDRDEADGGGPSRAWGAPSAAGPRCRTGSRRRARSRAGRRARARRVAARRAARPRARGARARACARSCRRTPGAPCRAPWPGTWRRRRRAADPRRARPRRRPPRHRGSRSGAAAPLEHERPPHLRGDAVRHAAHVGEGSSRARAGSRTRRRRSARSCRRGAGRRRRVPRPRRATRRPRGGRASR